MTDWSYDAWPSGEPYDWGVGRGGHPHDQVDFHVDLGCGRLKKGRIGIDHYPAPGVNVVMDLNTLQPFALAPAPGRDAVDVTSEGYAFHHPASYGDEPWLYPSIDWPVELRGCGWPGLPFPDNSIESIVTHHALEHIGDGFIRLMDEVYRVLKPNGALRIIVPLFPSWNAVSDPDHKRYFMATPGGWSTFDSFCGTPGDTPQNIWCASFSVPYTRARFRKTHQDLTRRSENPFDWWEPTDARELRVTLEAVKEEA